MFYTSGMASFSVRIVAALLSSSAVAPTLDCTGGGTAGGALTVTNTLAQSITILTCGEDSCTTPSYARCTPPQLAAGETATLSLLPAQHYVAFVYNASFEQECWPSEPGAFPSDSIRLPMADPRLACETAPPPSPGGGCDGTVIKQRQLVWNPNAPSPYATHSLKWNQSEIVVYPTSPVVTQSGWTGTSSCTAFSRTTILSYLPTACFLSNFLSYIFLTYFLQSR